jgi:hypothetical protein
LVFAPLEVFKHPVKQEWVTQQAEGLGSLLFRQFNDDGLRRQQ